MAEENMLLHGNRGRLLFGKSGALLYYDKPTITSGPIRIALIFPAWWDWSMKFRVYDYNSMQNRQLVSEDSPFAQISDSSNVTMTRDTYIYYFDVNVTPGKAGEMSFSFAQMTSSMEGYQAKITASQDSAFVGKYTTLDIDMDYGHGFSIYWDKNGILTNLYNVTID